MTRDELALLGHLIGDGCTLPRHAIQYTTARAASSPSTVAELAHRDLRRPRSAPRIKAGSGGWYQVVPELGAAG